MTNRLAALLAALLPAAAAAHPQVEVSFGDHSKFRDLRISVLTTERDREGLAAELQRHIEREAAGRLAPGTKLKVLVTDVDMAGEYPPVSGSLSRDLRVIKDVYPTRIDLEFQLLRADGSVERSGRRELRDLGFLARATPMSSEPLRYEKALLDDWLRRELAAAR